MILKNAYLSICLLWNHTIATKFTQTQALGLKSEALAAPVCFMLNMSPLPSHSSAGSLCPARRHNQQPHHEPMHDPPHTFPVRKKYYHGLGLTAEKLHLHPVTPAQDSELQQREGRQLGSQTSQNSCN